MTSNPKSGPSRPRRWSNDTTDYRMVDPTHKDSDFRKGLTQLWQSGCYCDITIIIEGHSLDCHRLILASWSSYFHSMFSNGMAETRQQTVELKDVSVKAFEMILDYMYKGSTTVPSVDMALHVLKTVDMLQFNKELRKKLVRYLNKYSTPQNCLDILCLADAIAEQTLKKAVKKCAVSAFQEVSRSKQFLALDEKLLAEYISDVELNVTSEDDVFFAVTRWIEVDPDARKSHAAELLSNIQFCFIDSHILFDSLEQNEVLRDVPEFHKYLSEAKRHQVIPCYRNDDHGRYCRPRKNYTMMLLVKSEDAEGYMTSPFPVDPQHANLYRPLTITDKMNESIVQLPDEFPQPASTPTCIVGNTVYMCIVSVIWKCSYSDTAAGPSTVWHWQKCNRRKEKSSESTLSLYGPHLYCIGGLKMDGGRTASRTIEIYNWEKDQWQNHRHTLLKGVFGHASVAIKDKIYVFGGHRSLDDPMLLQIYTADAEKKECTVIKGPRMPKIQEFPTAVEYRGKIYSFGVSLQSFDPETNCWTKLKPLPEDLGCSRQGVAVYGSKIIICGGTAFSERPGARLPEHEDDIELVNGIFRYDPETDTFDDKEEHLPSPMFFSGAVTLVKNKALKWL